MMARLLITTLINVTLSVAAPALGETGESAEALSAEALAACKHGQVAADRSSRVAQFERAEALAERAIAIKDDLAEAHFALFCGLGEQLRLEGESLTSLFGLQRVLDELDRTLTLDPNHLDALSAKGTLLQRLPGWLGGDEAEGERLLRRVVDEEPLAVNARLGLAKACAKRGEHEAARAHAARALAIAETHGPAEMIRDARSTLTAVELNAHRVGWTELGD